ncbi:DUF3027 domain-containing protein [Nesterenkonia alba]|uniref:DUF3027 domain-containing protein n=1 Tax=Nesterenkonia alba TaxID=515814 RepID=UPI0003B666D7|nr:DUF3027 domain-containing protein [Nesterenkonia alba]
MPRYKKDALLAEAIDTARAAVEDIAEPGQIGEHLSTHAEDDRLVTHRFAAQKPGYRGWEWFATLARAPRSKKATVCEIGLLPGAGALLAPEWVPWEERLNEDERSKQAKEDTA